MTGPIASNDKKHLLTQDILASGEHYRYDALPATGWTRILELHAGSGPLVCSVRSERIEDVALSYEALSYAWGCDALRNAVEIKCDGRVLSIGSNLACAMMHIRYETESRLLWVDAVCINQEDKDERSQQVQRMGDIYANAKRVLVWMGEDTAGDADECFALIKETNIFLMDMFLRYQSIEDIPPIRYGNGFICTDSRKWDMVRRLMNSEWFSRVWTLQEVGLARSAMIIYGKSSMEWSHLVELMLYVASRADVLIQTGTVRSGPIWEAFEAIWCSFGNADSWRNELPLTRSLNNANGCESLSDVLNVARYYQATDQRDRVYAFLSHPSATCRTGRKEIIVIADYNKSVDEVYLDTASRILETDPHPWTVLSCVDHTYNSPSLSGARPSWVPRWDEGWSVYWLGYPGMWYRAGGSPLPPFQPKFSKSDSSLEVQGIVLDTIIWVSQSFQDRELDLAHQKEGAPLQALWRELEQRDSNTVYVSGSQDREYIFSLVIAAGRAVDEAHEGKAEHNPTLHRAIYQAYKGMVSKSTVKEDSSMDKEASTQEERLKESTETDVLTYILNQRRALHNRRLFLTSKGYYGVGHNSLEVGDICTVFRAANMPFILRMVPPNEQSGYKSNCHRLIGESYIQGIMNGEALEMLEDGSQSHSSDLTSQKVIVVEIKSWDLEV